MSQAALCKGIRDHLQTVFTLDANSCEVGFDGQPKPMAGQEYFAIHPMGWTTVSGDWDLGEQYEVAVTVTRRLGSTPQDRRGVALWLTLTTGLEPRIRQVITAIHHNQLVRIACNVFITGGASGKLLTPPQFLRVEPPVVRDYNWFTAEVPENPDYDKAGVSQTIVFGKCQRVQSVPDMD